MERWNKYQASGARGTCSQPATAHRMEHPTAWNKSKMATMAPKWPKVSGKGSTPRLLDAPVNFRKISFWIQALLLWEKGATEKKMEKNGKNNDIYIGH